MSIATADQITPIPTREELIEQAKAMLPVLKERAAATEQARQTLPENVEDCKKLGFYDICKPKQYGGMEHHPSVLFEVGKILATACPSTSWCVTLTAIHSWELALLDPQAAEDVWGQDQDAMISSSYAPFGKVVKVKGGYEISGRWPWSSGSDQCNWVFLGGMVPGEGEMPDQRAFLIPRSEYVIEDTWHVAGLCGTGSKDIVVEKTFVPEHRTHQFAEALFMHEPGRKHFTSPVYHQPFATTFVSTLTSVTLGMAIGAYEHFTEGMKQKMHAYDGAKVIDDPFVRQRTAQASSMIRSAELLMKDIHHEVVELAEAKGEFDLDMRSRMKWDLQWIARQAMEATNLMFKAAGGGGIRNENPMQRFFRDIHAASNHAFLNADKGSLNAGGVFLGADPIDPTI